MVLYPHDVFVGLIFLVVAAAPNACQNPQKGCDCKGVAHCSHSTFENSTNNRTAPQSWVCIIQKNVQFCCVMLHPLFRFRYYILFGFFAIWMAFFDMNNLFYRYKIAQEVSALEENIAEHKKAIAELVQQKKYLFGNDRNLQRFAREKYLMKKDNEDVFVIVEEEKVEDNDK